jgi:hypothetical protein
VPNDVGCPRQLVGIFHHLKSSSSAEVSPECARQLVAARKMSDFIC